jgi:hypothetical protein
MDLQRGLGLEQGVCFKYLGIVFHSSICLAGCVAAARALLARLAMHDCRARCAELSIEAAPVQLQHASEASAIVCQQQRRRSSPEQRSLRQPWQLLASQSTCGEPE